MQLHKVLTKDKATLIRAMYSEDLTFLKTLNNNAALALDIAVSNALASFATDTNFYKLEMPDGALMGWFAITPVTGVLNAWYIRKQCRTKDLLADFNTLVQQVFAYGHFNSTGVNNIDPDILTTQDAQQVATPKLDYSGKNVLILAASN
jgi:hypothetical protein